MKFTSLSIFPLNYLTRMNDPEDHNLVTRCHSLMIVFKCYLKCYSYSHHLIPIYQSRLNTKDTNRGLKILQQNSRYTGEWFYNYFQSEWFNRLFRRTQMIKLIASSQGTFVVPPKKVHNNYWSCAELCAAIQLNSEFNLILNLKIMKINFWPQSPLSTPSSLIVSSIIETSSKSSMDRRKYLHI